MSLGNSKQGNTHNVAIAVALISAIATILAALIAKMPPTVTSTVVIPPIPQPGVQGQTKEPFVAKTDDCVGKWRWQTSNRSIEFDLKNDGSFTAENFPEDGGLWDFADGKGNWEVAEGRLTITMTHVGKLGLWKSYNVIWIEDEQITEVSPTQITFSDQSIKPFRRK